VLVVGEDGDISGVEDIYLYPGNFIAFDKEWNSPEDLFDFLGDARLWVWDVEEDDFVQLTPENWTKYVDIEDLYETPGDGMLVKYRDADSVVIDDTTVGEGDEGDVEITVVNPGAACYYAVFTSPVLKNGTWTVIETGVLASSTESQSITFEKGAARQAFFRVATSTMFIDENGQSLGAISYSANVGGYYTVALPEQVQVFVCNQFQQKVNTVEALFEALPDNSNVYFMDGRNASRHPVTGIFSNNKREVPMGEPFLVSAFEAMDLVFSGTLSSGDYTPYKSVEMDKEELFCSPLPITGSTEGMGISKEPLMSVKVMEEDINGKWNLRTKSVHPVTENWQGNAAPDVQLGEAFLLFYPKALTFKQTLTLPSNNVAPVVSATSN